MLIISRRPELTLRSIAAAVAVKGRNYSKDYASSSDDDEPKKQSKKQPKLEQEELKKTEQPSPDAESASARLNRLLATMQTDDNLTLARQAAASTSSTTMARPGDAHRQRKEAAKEQATSKDVFEAAKRVAAMLGDSDKKQTESELLSKLLGHNQQQLQDDAATTKSGEGAASKTAQPESELSLSDLIVGMKIDRRQQPKDQTRGDYVRRTLSARPASYPNQQRSATESWQRNAGGAQRPKREPESYTGSVNIFGCEPLGIFKDPSTLRDSPDMLATWAHLRKRELRLQVTHPPSNYFEKMALWTEQGKVWRFPIDNEQDMPAEEVDVDFAEHIFLEQHLEPWCPTRGPIRHFMELVCVGLSKNPYISAREKREHIHWYRDYFEAKRDILKDLMDKQKATTDNKAAEAQAQQLEG